METWKLKRVYNGLAVIVIYAIVFLAIILTGIYLYMSEEFNQVLPIEGDGEYLLHSEPLIPRESPDILIAEDGKLFLFYIDSELVNVYTVEGEYLYGIQFPDGQNGVSDMHYNEGLLCVDARTSGIYVFQDTQLLRFELQHYQNEGHDELEAMFTGEVDHTDGEYTYFYEEETNRIIRQNTTASDTVLQFPERKYDPTSFLLLIVIMLALGDCIWGKKHT